MSNLNPILKGNFRKIRGRKVITLLMPLLLGAMLSSCYAPLSSSGIPGKAKKKLYTHNHRRSNAAKWSVLDLSADCPSSSRRREKY
ncbi:hypothetical protein [Chondrinema litorale]|uniref:hypothetical protein n=1 Tax=Chondrinema litorale TaxID=2994555 RepID=UPI002542C9AD|nr:hypothetical protein [Chondrinema litorale]UZR94858.1 hypothetical protein OQ292_03400 [Chondrinema litorale]